MPDLIFHPTDEIEIGTESSCRFILYVRTTSTSCSSTPIPSNSSEPEEELSEDGGSSDYEYSERDEYEFSAVNVLERDFWISQFSSSCVLLIGLS